MSQEIDEKVVELVLDNRQFESNASQSMRTADKLNESMQMKGVEKGFNNINSAIKNSNIPFLGEAVEQVGLKFSGMWTIADQALRNITNSAMAAGKKVISALTIDPVKMGFSEYETKINAIQTIMSNTASKGTTMSDVTKVINELNTYADKTIYNFAEMTKNIGTFTAAGVGLEDSAAAIQGIANLAAASGSNSQQASTAMYQLSQALSTGTVRLMDWNSVVNAGMGGEKFQNALKETAKEYGVSVDKIVEKAGSFRESLSDGWLTADILNTTLKKFTVEGAAEYAQSMLESGKYTQAQVDALKEEAQAMEDAATKVKTFAQLFSTLEESLQSGWAQTWEIIIGDFEEAKEQLSDFAKKVGGVIDKMGEFRNEMLAGGLSSGWKQFIGKGVTNEEDFINAVTRTAIKSDEKIQDIIKDAGGFKESLEEGWMTTDILSEAITKYTKNLSSMSSEQLKAKGYTLQDVEAMQKLESQIKSGEVSLEEFITLMSRPSGAENLFASLNNAFDALMSIINPIADAFKEIFFEGKNMGEIIYSISVGIKKFTEGLILSDKASENLKRTFKGLFAVVDIVWQIFKALASNLLGPLLGGVVDLSGGILGVTATFGDWLVALRDAIKESDIFNKVFKKIADVIKTVWGYLNETIISPVWNVLSSIFERLGVGISFVGEEATSLKDKFLNAFNKISNFLESSGLIEFFEKLFDFISRITNDIGSKLANVIRKINFDKILGFLKVVFAGGIGTGIIVLIKKVIDFFGHFDDLTLGFVDSFKDLIDGITGVLEARKLEAKAMLLSSLAKSIALLVAALFLLSTIDTAKLWSSVAALTLLIGQLIGGMELLARLDIGKDKLKNLVAVRKMLTSMIAMGVALLLLASTMAIISKLDWGGMARGLVGVIALMGAMAGTVILLNKFAKDGMGKAVSGMILVAASIVILAAAFKIFDTISWKGMGIALISITTILGVIFGFCVGMSKLVNGGMKRAVGSLLLIATSLVVLAAVCKIFATMSWGEIGVGLTSVVILLAAIFGFAVGMSKLTTAGNVLAAALALITIGTSLAIMAGAMKIFNSIKGDSIAKSLATIIAVGSAMVGLAAITKALGPSNLLSAVGSFIILSAGLAALAGSLLIFNDVKWGSFAKAVASLAALMVILLGLGAITQYLVSWGGIATAGILIVLALGLMVLAAALKQFNDVSWGSFAKAVASLSALLGVLIAFGAAIAGLTMIPIFGWVFIAVVAALLLTLPLLGSGILLLAKSMEAFEKIRWGTVGKAIGMIAVLGVALGLLSPFLVLAGVGFAILGIGLIMAMQPLCMIALILGGVVAAFYALTYALNSLASLNLDALGVVISGLVSILQDKIPEIAKAIVSCIVQVLAYVAEAIPVIVQYLGEIILGILDGLIIYAPEIVSKLVELIGLVLESLGKTLAKFSPTQMFIILLASTLLYTFVVGLSLIAPYISGAMYSLMGLAALALELGLILAAFGGLAQISGLTWIIEEGGKLLGAIGTALGQFVGGLVGGIAQGFTSSLPQIATDLSAFMTNLKPFIEGAKLIDPDSMNAVKTLADVILTLTAANVMEGLSSWLNTGQGSFVHFGRELSMFGPYFKKYADAVSGINPTVVTASANAALALAEMANKLPNQGGLLAWVAGENKLSVFADELVVFGSKFKEYANEVSGINPTVVTASASAATALAELANNLPKSDGWWQKIFGNSDLAAFGDTLVSFGKSIKGFSNEVSGISISSVTTATDALNRIVSALTKASDIDASAVNNLSASLAKLGEIGVDAFAGSFEGSARRLKDAGINAVNNLVSGFMSQSEYMIVTFITPIESALEAIREEYQSFYDVGNYLVVGLANGISENSYKVAAKARAMAKAAAQAAEDELDINSPSKVFYGIGAFAGEGFIKALGDYGSESYNAGSAMADSARRGLSSAINSIKTIIDDGIDSQPTIRPVLDLSDVQYGANAISGMLSMGSSIGVSANVGAISAMMRSRSQNGGNSEVISAINKLRDSLSNTGNTTYTINGITYDDGSNIADAVQSIIRAARVERRS